MLQRVSRNQKGHTFALGSVNWEQPGHRTAGSVLQKVNRSYHSIWPLQCWDSAGGKCIIRKDTSTPVFTATLFITCQDCMHTQSPFSEMDGWTRGTRTHTHTHRHVYTLIHWHRTAQSKSRQNVFSSNMNRDANDRRSNSDKICLSKLHWYSLEGTV